MAVTLEQCSILRLCHRMLDSYLQPALDGMRTTGTRRENVYKNTNEPRYALTSAYCGLGTNIIPPSCGAIALPPAAPASDSHNTLPSPGPVDRYAFNKLQVYYLPKLYRPPPNTFGSTVT